MYTCIRKRSYEKHRRKFRMRFPVVSVPSKSSMFESWRWWFATPALTRGKLSCIMYTAMWNCKAIMLVAHLDIVFSWTPCAILDEIKYEAYRRMYLSSKWENRSDCPSKLTHAAALYFEGVCSNLDIVTYCYGWEIFLVYVSRFWKTWG